MSGLTLLARAIAVTVAVLTLTGIAHAACLSDDVVAKLVAGYPTTPVTGILTDTFSLSRWQSVSRSCKG